MKKDSDIVWSRILHRALNVELVKRVRVTILDVEVHIE